MLQLVQFMPGALAPALLPFRFGEGLQSGQRVHPVRPAAPVSIGGPRGLPKRPTFSVSVTSVCSVANPSPSGTLCLRGKVHLPCRPGVPVPNSRPFAPIFFLRRGDRVELLRHGGVDGVREAEVAAGVEVVGCEHRPVCAGHRGVDGAQNIIAAANGAIDSADHEVRACQGDAADHGRRWWGSRGNHADAAVEVEVGGDPGQARARGGRHQVRKGAGIRLGEKECEPVAGGERMCRVQVSHDQGSAIDESVGHQQVIGQRVGLGDFHVGNALQRGGGGDGQFAERARIGAGGDGRAGGRAQIAANCANAIKGLAAHQQHFLVGTAGGVQRGVGEHGDDRAVRQGNGVGQREAPGGDGGVARPGGGAGEDQLRRAGFQEVARAEDDIVHVEVRGAVKDEGAVEGHEAGREAAIGVVVADLEGAARGNDGAAADRAAGIVQHEQTVADGDAPGEIVAAGLAQRGHAGARFLEASRAGDIAGADEYVVERGVIEGHAAGQQVGRERDDVRAGERVIEDHKIARIEVDGNAGAEPIGGERVPNAALVALPDVGLRGEHSNREMDCDRYDEQETDHPSGSDMRWAVGSDHAVCGMRGLRRGTLLCGWEVRLKEPLPSWRPTQSHGNRGLHEAPQIIGFGGKYDSGCLKCK
jgi:hypothetical protein